MFAIPRVSVVLIMIFGSISSVAATVQVGDKEWFQPADVTGFSWYEIDAVCPVISGGVCNGSLGNIDLFGWTWASVEDVNSLFNAYIGSTALGPGPDLYLENNSTWAPLFLSDFSETSDPLLTGSVVNGITQTIVSNFPWESAAGATLADQIPGQPGGDGPDSATTTGLALLTDTGPWGVWLHRPSVVPVPTAAWLFGSALLGLAAMKRKKA